MNYLSYGRNSRKKKFLWQKVAGAVLVCLFLGLLAKSFLTKTFSSFTYSVSSVFTYILPQGFRSSAELAKENEELKKQIQILSAENADKKTLAIENADLKLRFGRSDAKKTVYATVLVKPPVSPYDTFILDAGSEVGISNDDTIVFGSLALGKIIDIGRGYSKAELFSSPGKVFEGTLGADHLQIEAKGVGNGSFEALVPIGTTVALGDTLVLPAISSKVFGIVQSVEELQTEGFKKILFALPVNPNLIGAVGILISK